MKEYIILSSILSLFLVGLVITLHSGLAGRRSGEGLRTAAGNFSSMLVRVVGYLAGLAVVQHVIGSPSLLSW